MTSKDSNLTGLTNTYLALYINKYLFTYLNFMLTPYHCYPYQGESVQNERVRKSLLKKIICRNYWFWIEYINKRRDKKNDQWLS